jgi:sortase A
MVPRIRGGAYYEAHGSAVGKEARIMGKHSRPKRFRHWAGFFLFGSLVLVVGGIALWSLVLNPGGSGGEPVQKADTPSVAEAPKPADKPAPEEPKDGGKADEARASDEDKKDGDKKDDGEKQPEEGGIDLASVPEPSSPELYLSVPKMGLSGDYVASGVDEGTLMNGAGRVPESGLPWQEGSNTYIASHVLGYEGTGSYMHFAALPSVTYGDQFFLTDANGTEYTYTVSEILQVSIYDTWVINPTGKTQVSLQTCINPPAYDVRLVVRGDLVDVKPA